MALDPRDDLIDGGRSVRHRPQVQHRRLGLPIEPELQGPVRLERLVRQIGEVVAVHARHGDLGRRVAEVDLGEAQRARDGDDAEIAGGDAAVQVEPRPLACGGGLVLVLDDGPRHAVVAALQGHGNGRRRPPDADGADCSGVGEVHLAAGRRVGVDARDLLQGAQVGVQQVDGAGVRRDRRRALVQRVDALLDAPQRHALIGQIRQQQIQHVVRDGDSLGGDLLRRHTAATHGIVNDALRREHRLRYRV